MRYLSGTDTQMLYTDGPNAMNMIAPIGIFDPSTTIKGRIDFEDVLQYVTDRLHLSTSFREKLVRVPLGLDRPVWINDATFDIEYHVRELALPAPGDWQQLTTQVSRLGARPLDLSRPPWELYVIHGIDNVPGIPAGSFVMMLKLHHAAMDGVAGAELVTALLQSDPNVGVEPPAEEWQAEQPPSGMGMLVRGGAQTVLRPVKSARLILRGVGAIPGTVKPFVRPAKDAPRLGSTVATRFNRPVSPHRVWDFVTFDLADVKAVKNAVPEVTVNDVAVTVVSGALRRYLEGADELPESTLNAIMPISTRPTSTQTGGSAPPDVSGGGGGNRFVMSVIPIGTHVADPLERIELVKRSTEQAKNYGTGMLDLVQSSELLPGALIGTVQRALARTISTRGRALGAHVLITNVPGPRIPMYFAGAKAVSYSGMAPVTDSMGLIVAIGGYCDDFSITFTCDRDMMPDPSRFAECLRSEFDALRAAALEH